MRVKVKVLNKYFKSKCRNSGSNCPVAQGLLAAGFGDVFVDGITIQGDYNGELVVKLLPKTAQYFIERFDDKTIPLRTFKPFSFTIDV